MHFFGGRLSAASFLRRTSRVRIHATDGVVRDRRRIHRRSWQTATSHGHLHALAAGATFIRVTVAMLLRSRRMRLDPDPRRRAHFHGAFAHAAIAFAAPWIYALVKAVPRGLGEKL